jgi:nucleotide-binding universal stress UspA family protein
MYHHIVVGTDGSTTASRAVDQAIELAAVTGATLHLVHAWDVSPAMARVEDDGSEMLAATAAVAAEAGVTVETHIVRSDPGDALVSVATEVGADLLVVGNRGMSGIQRLLLGSVANRISHHSPCTLLIVHTVD